MLAGPARVGNAAVSQVRESGRPPAATLASHGRTIHIKGNDYLVPSIGQPNRVYEVLNSKRGLTLDMIRNLHRNLGIPAESLIGP